MDSKILAVSTYPQLTDMINDISQELKVPISVYNGGIMKDGHLYAKKMEDKYNVIISQGGTVEAIKEIVNTPVVSIGISTIDIIKALMEAKRRYKNKIILFCYRSEKSKELEGLKSIINIDFEIITYRNKEEFLEFGESIVNKEDFTLVCLGSCIAEHFKKREIKSVVVRSSKRAIEEAIIDARNICDLNKRKKEKSERLKAIIDNSSEAIIAIDNKGIITTFNPVAETIFNLKSNDVVNRSIFEFKNRYDFGLIYDYGNSSLEDLISINGVQFIVNRIPIVVEKEETGIILTLEEVSKIQNLEQSVRKKLYKKGFVGKHTFEDIIGISKSIKETIDSAKRFGKTSATILIQGETGSGKEIFAQSIHNISNRAGKPFVAINCAALPENLLESELFGYEEGAFTGAKKGGKAGLFEIAHGGTIFLDEIGEIPLRFQSRLLRILQEKEVMRVGGDHIIKVDTRIISATNIDLYKMVKDNKFREDLYFRLNVLNLRIPPIRERKEDIPLLVNEFINKFNIEHNRRIEGLTPEAMELLKGYIWPGNVREIQNFVERMIILSQEAIIDDYFIRNIFEQSFYDRSNMEQTEESKDFVTIKVGMLKDMELQIIEEINNRMDNNKILMAKKLGISRTTLWKKLKELEEAE